MLALICSLFAAAAPIDAPARPFVAPAAKQRFLVGGYRPIDASDADVQAAAAFAAEAVEGELGEVTSAERQTVQGANFRLQFTTSDGRAYAAVVHRALDGAFSVTSIEETGDQHGEAPDPEE